MKLNKKICMRCVKEHSRVAWGRCDDVDVSYGYCPLWLCKTRVFENCYYRLEHILIEKKQSRG